MTLSQIASELSVDVIVEPSVMHLDDSVFCEEDYLAASEMIVKLEEGAASEKQVNIGGHVLNIWNWENMIKPQV